jgi:hypothetical protein
MEPKNITINRVLLRSYCQRDGGLHGSRLFIANIYKDNWAPAEPPYTIRNSKGDSASDKKI